MFSTKIAIDIIFIALIVIAISITAVVVARALTDAFSVSLDGAVVDPAQKTKSLQESEEASRLTVTDQDAQLQESEDQTFAFTDEQLAVPSPADRLADTIYDSWPFTLPITWGGVAGALIWRGKVRSAWRRDGYDYETFRLVAKMRGSPMRIKLLNAVGSPKNKLQLAKELQVDWKTIDNHIKMLLQGRLVEERTVVGTARYYAITQDGIKVLSLLGGDKVEGSG